MEDNRNNHAVERRLKEALKVDRARIQSDASAISAYWNCRVSVCDPA